jgi:hypothetical protein
LREDCFREISFREFDKVLDGFLFDFHTLNPLALNFLHAFHEILVDLFKDNNHITVADAKVGTRLEKVVGEIVHGDGHVCRGIPPLPDLFAEIDVISARGGPAWHIRHVESGGTDDDVDFPDLTVGSLDPLFHETLNGGGDVIDLGLDLEIGERHVIFHEGLEITWTGGNSPTCWSPLGENFSEYLGFLGELLFHAFGE